MKSVLSAAIALATFAVPTVSSGQGMPSNFADEFLRQFGASADKLVALAEAMPEDTYTWTPMEGVASVARVYMHIARYNYYYPETALGVDAPDGIAYDRWEDEVSDKERVLEILGASMDHVRTLAQHMSAEDLERPTRLYGRDQPQWAVLLQLVTHMNEHLGQSIAYARMNDVLPPWSR